MIMKILQCVVTENILPPPAHTGFFGLHPPTPPEIPINFIDPLWGRYGYFLELHNFNFVVRFFKRGTVMGVLLFCSPNFTEMLLNDLYSCRNIP